MAIAVWTTRRTAIAARDTAICTELLARALCPACGYKLHSLSPDPDGCTPCPECGAAWRVP